MCVYLTGRGLYKHVMPHAGESAARCEDSAGGTTPNNHPRMYVLYGMVSDYCRVLFCYTVGSGGQERRLAVRRSH